MAKNKKNKTEEPVLQLPVSESVSEEPKKPTIAAAELPAKEVKSKKKVRSTATNGELDEELLKQLAMIQVAKKGEAVTSTELKEALGLKSRDMVRQRMQRLASEGKCKLERNDNKQFRYRAI
jgi:predicted HTH transcriptional regulator